MKYGFGIDLGGTTVKIAYFNEAGKMLEKWEIPTDTSENGIRILPDIAASVRAFLTERKIADSDILGLGIGVPGPVNACLLYTSPSPRDAHESRMPSSA